MNKQHPEFEKDFQLRLDEWVSKQGLWFQIRHADTGGDLMRSFLGIGLRLVILGVILLVIGWYYLTKQVGSEGYTERLRESVVEAMNASDGKIEGVARVNSKVVAADLRIKRLELLASERSFFENREVGGSERTVGEEGDGASPEGLVVDDLELSPLGLFDGIYRGWSGNKVTIQRVTAKLKTSDESEEAAIASYQSLFKRFDGVDIRLIDIVNVDLSWGYSERTEGAITGAALSGELVDGAWSLKLTGGTFSYGFIEDARLVDMNVICRPEGIEITSAKMMLGDGGVAFRGEISVGANPHVSGELKFVRLDLGRVLDEDFQDFLSGSVSGEGTLGGRLGDQEGLDYDLRCELGRTDEIVVEDRFPFMQAMQFVDSMNSYRRFRFGNGRFHFRTEGSEYHLSDLNLRAGILLHLKGDLDVIKKEREEELEEIEVSNDEGEVEKEMRVAREGGEYPYYLGQLEISLPRGVFGRSAALQDAFELDDPINTEDDAERYEIEVQVDSYREDVTKELAEKITELYRRKG